MSFPKEGKFFPKRLRERDPGNSLLPGSFAPEIAAALRRSALDSGAGIKVVAGWTGANEKTVKNWFSGRYAPSGEHLMILIQQSDEVLTTILVLARREELVLNIKLIAAEGAILDLLAAVRRLAKPTQEDV